MSILSEMSNDYFYEKDENIEAVETEETPQDDIKDGEVVEPAEDDGDDAQTMVDAIVAAAPGMEKTIHSMLKYAANTDDEENVFDEALLYYEDTIMADETEAEVESDIEEVPSEEIPEE